MKKTEFLEKLIRLHGLIPVNVEWYRTDSCGGAFQHGFGYRGRAEDANGRLVFEFISPEGFNMALYLILEQAKNHKLHLIAPTEIWIEPR